MTNSAVCHNKVVNQQFTACSGSSHDDNNEAPPKELLVQKCGIDFFFTLTKCLYICILLILSTVVMQRFKGSHE